MNIKFKIQWKRIWAIIKWPLALLVGLFLAYLFVAIYAYIMIEYFQHNE